MAQIVSTLLYPLLLLVSIPLMGFALLTTAAALFTLLFRVLLLYADLAASTQYYFFARADQELSNISLALQKTKQQLERVATLRRLQDAQILRK
ncbi:MAG: hypothetical protein Q9200_003094 [Gallowayella weberi]